MKQFFKSLAVICVLVTFQSCGCYYNSDPIQPREDVEEINQEEDLNLKASVNLDAGVFEFNELV